MRRSRARVAGKQVALVKSPLAPGHPASGRWVEMGPKLEKKGPPGAPFNHLMHPRNIFREKPPDFAQLAAKYPEFACCCHVNPTSGKVWVDFKDPETVRRLTQVTLLDAFGLRVEIPRDCLVPRVPSRLNYILWIQDLLRGLPPQPLSPTIRGLDVGTGASVVYPLLGQRVCGWDFLATEKDPEAAECARLNVATNGLQSHIQVIKVSEGMALEGVVEEDLDFCMCNPPFFRDSEATAEPRLTRTDSRRPSRPPPRSITIARSLQGVGASQGRSRFTGPR